MARRLPSRPAIQTICRGRKQTVTHTDSHGSFSFELGDRMAAAAAGISERRRRFILEPRSAPARKQPA